MLAIIIPSGLMRGPTPSGTELLILFLILVVFPLAIRRWRTRRRSW